ncbi:hypothetical protein LTS10_006727 [Elasticomyces elasticus]|nr:hypothetical protein LTS10_006727 [Elasticomyces elasticus]
MPPKRHLRPFHQHPQPIPDSDPETDIPTEPPVLAPPPQRSNTELNLTVLRRYNPSINSIVSIAPFAVLYTFSPDSQAWEKCGVEGTLFICHLEGMGKYNAMILNRKSLENFEAELKSADDVEISEEYVILQSTMGDEGTPVIYGIWIFEDGDAEGVTSTREVVAQTILSCAMQAQTAREGISEPNGEANGHVEEVQDDGYYGMDGTTQMQAQMEEEAAVSQQAGQRLDLLQLFGSKSAALPAVSEPPQHQQQEAAKTTRFTPSADTEFFRSTAVAQQQQQQQQQTGGPLRQQNTLLDLFKK